MKILKTFNLLGMAALFILMVSCREPKNKQIYGTFVGTANKIETKLSTSEQISDLTESATLSITKTNDRMNVEVNGGKIYSKISNIPALDVSGNENYRYSYKSKDGSIEMTISSPDFNTITYNAITIYQEGDMKFETSFKGTRE